MVAQIGAKATDVLDASTRTVDESAETLPELEETSFTVDTIGWREEMREIDGKMRPVKVSPARDGFEEGAITSYGDMSDPIREIQHFTWEVAKYYTEKAGKRMPTKEEWEGLIAAGKTNNMSLSGRRNKNNYTYDHQGAVGYYWASSLNGPYAYNALFRVSGGTIAYNDLRGIGFSVWCIK